MPGKTMSTPRLVKGTSTLYAYLPCDTTGESTCSKLAVTDGRYSYGGVYFYAGMSNGRPRYEQNTPDLGSSIYFKKGDDTGIV